REELCPQLAIPRHFKLVHAARWAWRNICRAWTVGGGTKRKRMGQMGKGILLWLLGVPIPIIIILWLLFR
ncbi:hypothetical protein, partial [Sphingobium chlorophenolicum]|uniref:hypothetical protein n=1 Tax=Sphingobium chlorophenolicum TaxID=46429 RepID=UPI001C3F6F57